jgi:hypothetical protein
MAVSAFFMQALGVMAVLGVEGDADENEVRSCWPSTSKAASSWSRILAATRPASSG